MVLDVEVKDLYKEYDGTKALSGITFSVPAGSLFGIIGADGAGKSSLLSICTTLVKPDKGSARVLGKDVEKDFRYLRTTIGYMPQKFSLYQDLSVRENMFFFADIFGVESRMRAERMQRLLSFSRLEPFVNRRARDLSGGMKQKLALCCTLIHTPAILFLDEPTTGVDPVSRREFWEILFDLKKQGTTIVLSTPYMDEAQKCDELLFLHRGLVMRQGRPPDLLAAYPYPLFSVESAGPMLSYPHSSPVPEGIVLMYPGEGALRIAAKDASVAEADVFSIVKSVLPQAVSIRRVQPKIEDLFILLLSDQDSRVSPLNPPKGDL
jgi:ABC-2 type transport system ATP-binding protein